MNRTALVLVLAGVGVLLWFSSEAKAEEKPRDPRSDPGVGEVLMATQVSSIAGGPGDDFSERLRQRLIAGNPPAPSGGGKTDVGSLGG